MFLESDSHIQGLGAFLACTKRKLYFLSFVQRLVAFSTNGREMYEDVFSTFAFDEAKAFVVVEPFYGSGQSFGHPNHSFMLEALVEQSTQGLQIKLNSWIATAVNE
jgi:hypothetical protein